MSLLAECAHGAARTISSQFYGYHRLLARRIGYKRAILATAHSQAKTGRAGYSHILPMAYLQSMTSLVEWVLQSVRWSRKIGQEVKVYSRP